MIREWAFVFFGDKPLYLCCWVFCLGMALAYWGIFSVLPLIAFLITAIIAVMIAFLSKKWPWLLIAFCFLGAFYWHSGWNQPESLPFAPGSSLEVEGEIIGNPSYKENKFTVLLRPQKINGQKYHENKLQIMGEGKVPVLAGDTVLVRGKLLEDNPYGNSNAFDYGQYLWRQGITGVISTLYNGEIVVKSHGSRLNPSVLMGKLNNRLDKALDFLPDQQKSYVEGVFLGKKSDLSFYDKKILTETGLLHAFSVSGLHIGYIVLLIGFLLGRDQQKKLVFLLLSMGILFFYLFLVGFGTAVLRAFLMSLTVLLAQYFNEKSDMQTSLALVAVLMLLWNPALLFDAAFQLSFVSVLGMSYLMPVFSGFFPVKNYWTESLAITFSASWAIMPLIAYYFYLLSFSSWLLAPLVLVLIGLVVMISFVAAFLAIFSITLAVLPLYACGFLMDMVIKLCYLAADLPLSWISIGKPPLYILAIYYFLLLLIPLFWHQKRKKAVIIMLLSSLCLLIIPLGEKAVYDQQSMPVWAEEDDCLEVVFLDIGQGDCCIIHTPLDKLIIIDAGGKRTDPQWMGKYIVLPYLQSRGWDKMDLIISSHPHEDH
ncbi:MAG: ComEC/Rec2 family competence protein, partial [Clostridiales bacterium]